MKLYSVNEITDKLNSYFKSINNGEPVTNEQAEVLGHVLMALKDTTPRYPNTLNARVRQNSKNIITS